MVTRDEDGSLVAWDELAKYTVGFDGEHMPADAEARGIKNGDTIRVFNDYGAFLRPAAVTRTVMPGVIMVPHGAGARFDAETGLDLSGADNVLTSSNRSTTPFLNGWNTNLCQYEKYDGTIELVPDCEMPQIILIAE